MNRITVILIVALVGVLSSCGKSTPSITRVIVKSDSQGVVFDSQDSSELSSVQDLFEGKKEEADAGPDFMYFIDITVADKTVRWQYSEEGYLREYGTGKPNTIIYQIQDVDKFNQLIHVRQSQ